MSCVHDNFWAIYIMLNVIISQKSKLFPKDRDQCSVELGQNMQKEASSLLQITPTSILRTESVSTL